MRASTGPVVALIAACTLAGCGAGSVPRTPANPEFIDLVAALPRSLDPADAQAGAFAAVETSLAGTLVRPAAPAPGSSTLAPAGRMTGFLATSWRVLSGGDIVLALRPGVRSAFGHTLSGADVRFSFARELALSGTARFLAGLAGISLRDPVTVLGPLLVRVNVTPASPFALELLGDFRFGVLDAAAVRAHASAADPRARSWLAVHLAGYGAYDQLGFDPGSRLLLRANRHFWRPLGFGLVAVEAFASSALRLADVAAGEASATGALSGSDFAIAAHTSGLRALRLPSATLSVLVPDERFAPFASVSVRRALSLAIDRAAIARDVFGGFAKPALEPVPSTFAPEPGGLPPPYAHDVDLARRLLARAGHAHGFTVALAASPAESPQAAAELAAIAAQLRAIGVHAGVRLVASPADLAALERSGSVAGVLESVTAPVASVALTLAASYLRGSPFNTENYDDPALDALAGPLTRPPATGAPGAVTRALAIVAGTFPVIPLVELPDQVVTRAAIGGYGANPAGAVYFDRLGG